MILPHSHAPGLEDLPIVPSVLGEYDRGMKAFPAVKPEGRRILARKVDLKMGEKKFLAYKPNGEEIHSVQEFVAYYVPYYYKGHCALKDASNRVVSQTNCVVEKYIDHIIENGIHDRKDLVRALAWKMGKIKQDELKDGTGFAYHEDWKNAEENPEDILRYGKPFEVSRLFDQMLENKESLKQASVKDALQWFQQHPVNNLGTVYMITLLYFISQANYPIYDQFAKKAIDAIKKKVKPSESIPYEALPDKNNPQFSEVEKMIEEFKKDIDDIFGYENYKASRDIDRALWVYGHLFKDKSKSAC